MENKHQEPFAAPPEQEQPPIKENTAPSEEVSDTLMQKVADPQEPAVVLTKEEPAVSQETVEAVTEDVSAAAQEEAGEVLPQEESAAAVSGDTKEFPPVENAEALEEILWATAQKSTAAPPVRKQKPPVHEEEDYTVPPAAHTAVKEPAVPHPAAAHHPKQPTQKKKRYNSYKRSTVRQFSSLISLLIMVPVFGLIVLFNWFFPRSQESMIEKRKLAEFPTFTAESYFSGQFTAGINTWFTDTVPYRDDFKNAGNGFKGMFGITTEDTVNFVGDVKKVPKKVPKTTTSSVPSENSQPQTSQASQVSQTSQAEPSKPQESSQPEESSSRNYREEDADYKIENGVIVVYQDGHYRGLEMFGGGSGNAYVDALNDLRDRLDDDVRMYSMIAPLASEYYTPANCAEYTVNQKEYFDDLASRLHDGITSIDIDSVLAQHTAEPIYCRTDHHWMPLGAYYATQTFAKVAGVDFKELSTFQPKTIEGFVGTMYAFSGGDINIKNDPEDFTYYVPDNYGQCRTDYYDTAFNYDGSGNFFQGVGDPQTNAYLTFFGGDEQIVKVHTNIKNGRKLLIIKDSYGNAEPEFLMNSFEDIYIVDMRYFQPNLVDFIEQLDITDVLFTMVTYSAFGDNSYNLPDLITQNAGMTIVDGYHEQENE